MSKNSKMKKSQTSIQSLQKALTGDLTTSLTVPEQELDYDSALEVTGQGYFNRLALTACTLIFMHSLIEMIALAYAIDSTECDLELTILQKTLIGSAVFFGLIVTAICWGSLGDIYGRKKIMLPAVFGTVIVSFVSSLCTAFWTMFVMRLLTGALVSASSATVLVYLGELHTTEHRDSAISWAITVVAVAFVIVPGVAWAIIPGRWSLDIGKFQIKPWRVYIWTFGITGLIGGIMLIFLPESPSFIATHKGETAAIPILAKMWHYNHMKDPNIFPVRKLKLSVSTEHAEESALKTALHDLAQLVRAPIRRPFLITHFCMFMVFLLANGVYLWMPGIFNLVMQDTNLPWSICMAIKSRYTSNSDDDFVMVAHHGGGMDCSSGSINTMIYPMSIVMEVLFLFPFIIITVVIEKFDKSLLYACVMLPCAVGLALCAVIPQVLAAAAFMTIGLCSGSAASILSALAVDAFPTSLRALVMCTMYMMGQVGAVLGNTFVGIAAQGPCEIVFFIMSAFVVASVLAIVLLWPDLHQVRRIMEERHFAY